MLPSGPKPANTRCQHLSRKGCRIYATRPEPCRYWSCRWLFDEATAGLRRPDHSGVIIDPTLDTILADGRPIDVLQIWCDPRRPDAHRAPALRAYLADVERRHGLISIARWNSADGVILVPPRLSKSREWLELGGSMCSEAAMRGKLAAAGAQHASRRPHAVIGSETLGEQASA